MTTDLTLDELTEMVRALADPANDDPDSPTYCDTCCGGLPGTIAPILTGGDPAHSFVENCGSCRRLTDEYANDTAAKLIADALGLNVRRRYDDASLAYWRVFLARPGSPDDRDTYCVDADEFGCWPSAEIAVVAP